MMDQSKGEVRKNKAKHENDQELTKRTKNARKTHEKHTNAQMKTESSEEARVFWKRIVI